MTLSSMTGFARTQGTAGEYAFVFELKSVNGRGLDLRFRLQSPFDGLEAELRTRAQKVLSRGNVQIGLTVRREAGAATVRINEALFAELAEASERLAWSAKLTQANVGDLMRLPGVVEAADTRETAPTDAVLAEITAAFDAALALLVASRQAEGAALHAILSDHLDQMAVALEAVLATDALRPAAIRARLDAQVKALLEASQAFDADRLHQEAVLLASRVDVREEIDRFGAHLATARALLSAREPVGRKLDFLTQEFVREVNTLCSKANDIALTRIGLDLKAVVEQFREQVQNIE